MDQHKGGQQHQAQGQFAGQGERATKQEGQRRQQQRLHHQCDQHRAGRLELLSTSFESFERRIRDQLGRILGPGGFDPARDVRAITVNRWPHGYTYNYNTLVDPVAWALAAPEDRAFVVGRRPFGRIAIANADAGGSSHTDAAIEQAYRAVREVVESRAADYVARLTDG